MYQIKDWAGFEGFAEQVKLIKLSIPEVGSLPSILSPSLGITVKSKLFKI